MQDVATDSPGATRGRRLFGRWSFRRSSSRHLSEGEGAEVPRRRRKGSRRSKRGRKHKRRPSTPSHASEVSDGDAEAAEDVGDDAAAAAPAPAPTGTCPAAASPPSHTDEEGCEAPKPPLPSSRPRPRWTVVEAPAGVGGPTREHFSDTDSSGNATPVRFEVLLRCAADNATLSALAAYPEGEGGGGGEEDVSFVGHRWCRVTIGPSLSHRPWLDVHRGLVRLHLEPVPRLKTKAELRLRLPCPCVVSRWQPFFKFVNTNGSRLVRCTLVDNGWIEVASDSRHYNVLWTGKHVKRALLQSMNVHQKINHFPRTFEITRKDRLYKNVTAMGRRFPKHSFDFLPKTYVLPGEHARLAKRLAKTEEKWILKPNSSSRGRGIFIIKDVSDISTESTEKCVVCKYVRNPLLVNGLKFDLRIYVAITSVFPLRLWIFEEGLTRFATEKYTHNSYNNPYIHLTNYSINKSSRKFVRNTDADADGTGNKWTLSAFLRFLRQRDVDVDALNARIRDVILKAFLSVEDVVYKNASAFMQYRTNCFELFGVDVLIDDNLKPWILEFNLSPSLSADSPLDRRVKSRVVADLFNMAGHFAYDRLRETPDVLESARIERLSHQAPCYPVPRGAPRESPGAGKKEEHEGEASDGDGNGSNGSVDVAYDDSEGEEEDRAFFASAAEGRLPLDTDLSSHHLDWAPFTPPMTRQQMRQAVLETQAERDVSGGWRALFPVDTDAYDVFFPPPRRHLYAYMRKHLFPSQGKGEGGDEGEDEGEVESIGEAVVVSEDCI